MGVVGPTRSCQQAHLPELKNYLRCMLATEMQAWKEYGKKSQAFSSRSQESVVVE